MELLSLLLVAFLFGGMLLFSLGFGTLAFKFLEVDTARQFIRKTFPLFYLYIFSVATVASSILFFKNFEAFLLNFIIAVTVIPTWLILMPAINSASDKKLKRRFVLLHSVSVFITLFHIIIAAFALILLQ
tara:strand:- start:503 stop:892 length:390 start_codon:yes stop_codon:yes gene_type:complete